MSILIKASLIYPGILILSSSPSAMYTWFSFTCVEYLKQYKIFLKQFSVWLLALVSMQRAVTNPVLRLPRAIENSLGQSKVQSALPEWAIKV